MSLDRSTIEKLAEHLENAELNCIEVTKITDKYPDITWDECLDVQWEIRRRKEAVSYTHLTLPTIYSV